MDRTDESIYLLDMTRCEPRSAISSDFDRGAWTSVAYSVAEGQGHMLLSGPESQAPPVHLTGLPEGWFHVFIATFRSEIHEDWCLLLKLSDDPGYTRATAETFRIPKDFAAPEMIPGRTDLSEAYWKAADLTARSIVFHRQNEGERAESIANIAYVRLVPCSEREIAQAKRDRERTDTRRLIANYDGGQHHLWNACTDAEMADEFQPLDGADVGMLLWGCARSLSVYYPSRRFAGIQTDALGMPGRMREWRKTEDRQRRHGFDPLASAVRHARRIGIGIYPQVRMSGEQLPPRHKPVGGPGDFQANHPEYRCVTAQGRRTRHLSQAFPEVRAEYAAMFREWVEDYDADGVCIVFCRSYPYVLYEEPVRESFRERYGTDMAAADPFDRRVLLHRAEFLTSLLLRDARDARRGGRSEGTSLRDVLHRARGRVHRHRVSRSRAVHDAALPRHGRGDVGAGGAR